MTFADAVIAAAGDLFRKQVLVWVLATALVAAAVLVAFWSALGYWLLPLSTGFAWLDDFLVDYVLLGVGAVVAATVTALLFPALVTTCAGLFTDRIAAAVEQAHYPDVTAHDIGPLAGIAAGLRLIVATVVVTVVVVSPLWLLFAGTPVWLPLWFVILGYLLGREYFDTAAERRCPADQVPKLRRARFLEMWAAGILIACAFAIPFLALFAWSFGTALMVHVVQRGMSSDGG